MLALFSLAEILCNTYVRGNQDLSCNNIGTRKIFYVGNCSFILKFVHAITENTCFDLMDRAGFIKLAVQI